MADMEFDVLAIVDALQRHDVEYVAVGGWAALQHGASRPTNDLDICPRWTAQNLERVARALRDLGAEILIAPGQTVAVPLIDGVLISRMHIGNWNTQAGGLDVLKEISRATPHDLVGYAELATHATEIDLHGRRVRLAALDAVVRSKEVANRPKDHEALGELRDLLKRNASKADPP